MDFHRRKCQFLEKNYTIQKSYSKNKKSSSFHSRSKNDGIMVIFGSGAESRPAWTRMWLWTLLALLGDVADGQNANKISQDLSLIHI